jgi:hypothetical protein
LLISPISKNSPPLIKYFIHKRQIWNPPNGKRPEGFVSLSKIILEQQVSLSSAEA